MNHPSRFVSLGLALAVVGIGETGIAPRPLAAAETAESTAAPASDVNWPSFQNGGVVAGDWNGLPQQWSSQEGVAWQAEVAGIGQSTPLVAGGRVFVTSVSGDNKEHYHLTALDLASGSRLWEQPFANPTPVENTNYVSRAAPTGVVHEGGVITPFEGGLVVSVDADGDIRWRRDLVADYGPITARHGLASSLEQNASAVFLMIERGEAPYVVALAKDTGQTVWKVDGLGVTSWSTPRLVPTSWGDHLVCSGSGRVIGLDPETGRLLWDLTDISNNSTCTPVPVGENRFLIGASDGRGEENAGSGASSNGVIEIRRDEGAFAAGFVWRAEKASSSFGTPIAAADSVWIVNRAGVLFRLDLETGEQQNTTRVDSGSIWATPLATRSHLYLFGQKGTSTLVELPAGRPVASSSLESDGETLYAVAVAGSRLLFRFGSRVIAVE